ncbi:MAG: polyprenyl synthetase family protein [Solitalea-like symbiont of Acarus siro]
MLDAQTIKCKIEESIFNLIEQDKNLAESIKYIMSLPSKSIRPILLILSSQIFDGNYNNSLDAALAIELFHNFTLVHDDIMDKAPLRRGKETIHELWGTNTAILSGDILLIKAYQQLAKINSKNNKYIFKIFTETALKICKGQDLDLQYEQIDNITKAQYLEVIKLKTGVLLGASMQIGALTADCADYEHSQHLYNIGENLGVAFQLQDDLFDLYPPANFGKTIGGDIIANKKTIFSIMLNSKAGQKTQNNLNDIKKLSADQKIKETKAILDSLNAEAIIKEEIAHILEKSLNSLKYINGSVTALNQIETFINKLIKA